MELLIVVGILLLLTVMVVGIYNRDTGGNRMREAGRSVQASFMGAKDRALHAKERAGLRFLRDPNNTNLATGFIYVQPLEKLTFGAGTPGSVAVCRPDANNNYALPPEDDATADEPRILVVDGNDGSVLRTLDQDGLIASSATFQIPAGTGPYYRPLQINATAPMFTTVQGTYTILTLTANVAATTSTRTFSQVRASDFGESNATFNLDLGYEITPNHQPLSLPSGVVIDLVNSSANLTAGLSATDLIDVIYAPSGTVYGSRAAKGPIHLLLRDIRDATEGNNPLWVNNDTPGNLAQTQPKYEMLVVTLFPQTGHVQSYPVNLADAKINATGLAGTDGLADDLFWFAKTGNRAGN